MNARGRWLCNVFMALGLTRKPPRGCALLVRSSLNLGDGLRKENENHVPFNATLKKVVTALTHLNIR